MASRFPDPAAAPADAPLAVGGDLEPHTLLEAYRSGIFPWPSGDGLYWWSPDPRTVLPLDGLRVSRNLRRAVRSGRFSTSVDAACRAVIEGCADRPGEGTWITPAMVDAYARLHDLGHVHSLEVWDRQDRLVGGVYGVAVGAAFTAESMFHRASDAGNVALLGLVGHLRERGFDLLDVQLPTPHLDRLGARPLPRAVFLRLLARATSRRVAF